jgi:TetR/AcrR family transcriptional regulator, tetracycline repressor protein
VRRTGRPKEGQNPLSQERILAETLKLIDEGGVEAYTMRRLATELGVDPMAIYHHFPNKRAVIGGLVEAMLRDFQLSMESDWRDGVRQFAYAYREMVRAHANLVLYFVMNNELAAEGAFRISEPLYAILQNAGLSPVHVLRAADTVIDFLNGFALGERNMPLGEPGERSGIVQMLESYSLEEFPAMRWLYAQLSEDEMRGDFDTALNILIAGIEALSTSKE